METKVIAWITFDILGGIFVVSNVLAKVNTFLDAAILFVLFIYVCLRSYIRLRRDMIALRKETWEQNQREIKIKIGE